MIKRKNKLIYALTLLLSTNSLFALECPDPNKIHHPQHSWQLPQNWRAQVFSAPNAYEPLNFYYSTWIIKEPFWTFQKDNAVGYLDCHYYFAHGKFGYLILEYNQTVPVPQGNNWLPYYQLYPLIGHTGFSCFSDNVKDCRL